MLLLLAGIAALTVAGMIAAWIAQRRAQNAGWVDVFWTFSVGLAGALGALAPVPSETTAAAARAVVIAALILVWSARLGFYLVKRVSSSPREDVRYARFRADWGQDFDAKLFWLLMIQAAVAALLAACVMLAARNPAPFPRAQDFCGMVVLAIAVAGETLADRQMHRFRRQPANRGKVCDTGLWAWSRHPNYFFETLFWCAFPLFAISPSWRPGWLALAGPAAMAWLLTRVSGIPPLEREMLHSRGAAYRDYQSRVSPFLPRPPSTPSRDKVFS